MSLTHLNPLSEIRDQIDRIFYDFTEEPRLPAGFRSPEMGLQQMRAWMPPVEISETDKDVVVRAQLPGMKPEDIHVEVAGNSLALSGECRRETKRDEKQFHRTEFQYGNFRRTVTLPDSVQADRCDAEFHDGLLEIHLPKMEESRRKRIEVKSRR